MRQENEMHDKNGMEIKAGDTLFNPHDRDRYHEVLQDDHGKLYLGDFESPLELFGPEEWWEVTPPKEIAAHARP